MANNTVRRIPDRAMQFAPFAALKGYYESVRKQERITQPKVELGEEDAEAISNTLNNLYVGALVIIRYYDIDSYMTLEGMISEVNFAYHRLKVDNTSILFTDIYSITITGKRS